MFKQLDMGVDDGTNPEVLSEGPRLTHVLKRLPVEG